VPNVTLDELGVHLSKWPASGEDLVFTGERGGPIRHSEMTKAWAAARDCAGVPDWARLHDLRHYYASLLIAGGASVKVVQARLGHSSAKTTLDTYGHLWPDDEDRTRRMVDLVHPSRVPSVSRGEI
jgi:integrase